MEVGENRVRVFYGTEKREGESLKSWPHKEHVNNRGLETGSDVRIASENWNFIQPTKASR
jgi:hypothetical protein